MRQLRRSEDSSREAAEPTFRIQMAAEISGVKAGLIRAWERRHGVLEPTRSPGGYRIYTQSDIQVLKHLKRLTEEGMAIAEAVKQIPAIEREVNQAPRLSAAPRKGSLEDQLKVWREGVLEAARGLDQPKIEAVLDAAIEWLPPLAFFDGLIVPLVREAGERWHAGTLTIAEEHLISQSARQRLLALWS